MSFILKWFEDILGYLGLKTKKGKLLFLGLDNAGKTTLLHMLKDDRVTSSMPTIHPHSEELVINQIRFRTFDVGGHQSARRIWKDYYHGVDALVFMIDSSDRSRFAEAAQELSDIMESQELSTVPIVVLGNKIDIPDAASEDELRTALGLHSHMTYGKAVSRSSAYRRDQQGIRPIEVFMCSLLRRQGYAEAFNWIAQFLD